MWHFLFSFFFKGLDSQMKRKFVCHDERNGAVRLFKEASFRSLEDNRQGVLKRRPGTNAKD